MSARRLGIHVNPAESYYEDGVIYPVRGTGETFEGPMKKRAQVKKGAPKKVAVKKPAVIPMARKHSHGLAEYGVVEFIPNSAEDIPHEYAPEMGVDPFTATIAATKAASSLVKAVKGKKAPKKKAPAKAAPPSGTIVNVSAPAAAPMDQKKMLLIGAAVVGLGVIAYLATRKKAAA